MENIAIKNYLLQHNVPCITPKAALIDMDGVLYDSMKNHVEAWYRTLTPMGFKCSKEEFYLYEGRTGASTIKYLFDKHFGKQVSDDECAEIYKIKEKHLFNLSRYSIHLKHSKHPFVQKIALYRTKMTANLQKQKRPSLRAVLLQSKFSGGAFRVSGSKQPTSPTRISCSARNS